MKTSVLFAILAQLLVVVAQNHESDSDPCVDLRAKSPVSYKEAVACYHSKKLTEELRESTIDTLRKTLPLYAFIDIYKKSPDNNLAYQVDIDAEIRDIGKRSYKSEAEFQTTLTKFFNSLHDGHTKYKSCFSMFSFVQPFPLYTIVDDNGQTRVKVLDDFINTVKMVSEWKSQGIDVKKYAGAEVLSINGLNPLEYIEKYADEYISTSRDVNSRINYALARVVQTDGIWGLTYGSFKETNIIPATEKLDFAFKVGNEVELVQVPYLVNISAIFNSTAEFYSNFCSSLQSQTRANSFNLVELKKGKQEIPEIKEIKVEAPLPQENSRSISPLVDPISKGLYSSAYLINNDTTGVITINTFSAGNELFEELKIGFEALKARKTEKLILDLSNNGGGEICSGYNLMEYLFPNSKQNYFNTDMHSSPLLRELTRNPFAFYFSPRGFRDQNSKQFRSNEEFTKILSYPRGTVPDSKYTPLFQDTCYSNPLQSLFNADGSAPFKKENIALVTNSICYSTCALVANGMQEFHDIKSYAVGGLKDRPSTVGSVAGGTVLSFGELQFSLKQAKLRNHPDAPQPFKSNIDFKYTAREAYSSKFNDLRPLEFTWLPSKHKINFNKDNVFDPYAIWTEIALEL